MPFSPTDRTGATLAHLPRPRPSSSSMPTFDEAAHYDVVRDSVMAEEHIYGAYAGEGPGVVLCGVTNRRVLLFDRAFPGGRSALTTVPYKSIVSVSYVSRDDEPIFARTIAIQFGRTFYEITCRGEEQAAEIHDLITWHLM
jgi:hypothetical protein